MVNEQLSLKRRITSRKARIAVIGVGYVGLPLAVSLAEKRFAVIGADKSKAQIDPLIEGKSTVEGLSNRRVKTVVRSGRLKPLHVFDEDTSQPNAGPNKSVLEQLVGVDVFVVCVHTPLRKRKGWQPDLRWITLACKLIEAVCKEEEQTDRLPTERLIVLESTSYPGTTNEVFGTLLKDFSQKHDLRWYLAYSPERTDPGPRAHVLGRNTSKHRSSTKIPRIVAGLDLPSRDAAVTLYSTVFKTVEPVEDLETAEMIKLLENSFRFVSIGFANEMARISRAFGLNIWEIVRAAKTKDFGLDLCFPGLVGGHCIPIDPHYLSWAARNKRRAATLIDAAEKAHQDTKREALDLIRRLLNQRNKGIHGARILFFGVAYKPNVSDFRESPSLALMKETFALGAKVCFWDPLLGLRTENNPLHLTFAPEETKVLPAKQLRSLKPLEGVSERSHQIRELKGDWEDLRNQILGGDFDCIVIATDHDCFQPTYEELILTDSAPPIADLRNAVENWFRGSKKPPGDKVTALRVNMSKTKRYMLLGLH